jgi:LysW-gamma-L-lysine carboxypeptidase
MPTITPPTAIELLTKLVSIPSPSQHEAKASAYLAGWLNAHGFAAQVDEAGNAVGIKGRGPREILLLGHIDTFPGDVPLRRDGDLLYGRGAVDAKGPLCAFAAAAAQVDVPAGWYITVVGAVEEESATSKGARHILSQRLRAEEQGSGGAVPKGGFARGQGEKISQSLNLQSPPVFCIIGEPSQWDRITLGYKGRLLLDVTLTAPFSHSAGEGKLPAEQGVALWRQIEQFCAAFNAARQASTPFTRLEPSLRHIASRDAGAYGQVDLNLGFRLPVGLTPAELEPQIRQHVDPLPEGVTAALHFSGGELAYKGDKSNPLVRAFLRAVRAAGGQPRFVVKTGTADMNVVGPHWPVTPIVAYGPGDSSLDHTPTEHLDLNEYTQAIEVLRAVLAELVAEGSGE